MSPRRLLAGMLALAVLAAAGGAGAGAQEADGRISGAITMGSADATLATDALDVRVIVLEAEAVVETLTVPVEDGRYEVRVPATLSRTYVPVVSYRGIAYFVPPVLLDASAPEVVEDVTVYETTTERPDLTIESTVVTLFGIDREVGHAGFIREDLVTNPSDRVYIGDERGVTLRLPAPEGTIQGSGDNVDGTFTLEAGAISAAVPLRPLSSTSVITRYLVEFDPADDDYLLRVTAPLQTGRVEVHVPQGWLRDLDPEPPAIRADDVTVGTGVDASVLSIVALPEAGPGQSLLVRLEGFGLAHRVNPLTELPGAVIAAAGVAAVLGIAVAAATRQRREAA